VARWKAPSACRDLPSARLDDPSVRRNGGWSASERSQRAAECSPRVIGCSRRAGKEPNTPKNRPGGWRKKPISPVRDGPARKRGVLMVHIGLSNLRYMDWSNSGACGDSKYR
jgi:hypothetical protein